MTAENPSTSFLDLPAELRNNIYTLALPHDQFYMWAARRIVRGKYIDPSSFVRLREPGLLAINRQIRGESLSIFYSRNTFVCQNEHLAVDFLVALGAERAAMLTAFRPLWIPDTNRLDQLSRIDVFLRLVQVSEIEGPKSVHKRIISVPFRRYLGDPIEWVRLIDVEDLMLSKEDGDWSIESKDSK